MNRFLPIMLACAFVALVVWLGYNFYQQDGSEPAAEGTPSFSLAWSEYPSWSVFGVAHERGLINGAEGKVGPIEKKHGVDIILKEADYDTCITLYGSGTVDASCQTNIDSLAPSLTRDSVVILPTSTSIGGDACIAVNFPDQGFKDESKRKEALLQWLKNNPTYGLEKSVSQYVYERNLELMQKDVDLKDYSFKNMDPAAASQAVQTGQAKVNCIMVWNPFVLQTLRTRQDSQILFDSSTIPEEVIDCVVVSKQSLAREGGSNFAKAVIETFYEVNKMLADPKTADATYVALGAKFSSLGAEDMKKVCQTTRFYDTPEKALVLMQSKKFQTETMPMIADFCQRRGMVKQKPVVGFNNQKAQLNFDDSHLQSSE